MSSEKVLVMGASTNPERYSWIATKMLQDYKHMPICYGKNKGFCAGFEIHNIFPHQESVDTVTLYLNPANQEKYYKPIVDLKPKRVIFNPGTENHEFQKILETAGIEYEEACTLVLLRTNQW